MQLRNRRWAAGIVAAGAAILFTGLVVDASAAAAPKGNNGTIKIDGTPLQGGQANEPKVSCEFDLEFFGYDRGDLNASITFALQAPTRRSSGSQVLLTDTVAIGEDPAGGGTDLDAQKHYRLDFAGLTPHPQQGYHVKVTIRAAGSQGADVKHKVFWVQPCPVTTTTTTSTITTVPTPPTTVTMPPSTAAPTAAVAGQTTTTTLATQVAGEQVERSTLPRTGSGAASLALLGGLALVIGGLISLFSKPESREGSTVPG